eukprot:TRINITY_DN1264_c0_g1_i3.p1 TRINITY_DN1264_c0_g1~~TRINITY_DN1264_c0_g1_i3.p1  ORF type:complete len:126 (+),score=51.82 TRINITY_DN1264_c0_g1_i3:158-535(+)
MSAAAAEGPADTVAQPPQLCEAVNVLCGDVADYIRADVECVRTDVSLLEAMNKAAAGKFAAVSDTTAACTGIMADLQAHYTAIKPYLEKIDLVYLQVSELEKVVLSLDEYSKRLEGKFKKLQSNK